MKHFKYTYKDISGETHTDSIQAESIQQAREIIENANKIIIKIAPKSSLEVALGKQSSLSGGKIKKRELALIFSQLAFMKSSGLQVHTSLKTLSNTTSNKAIKNSLGKINKAITEDGKKFYTALFEQEEIYGNTIPNQIKAGEVGGKMDETMQEIADQLDKEDKFSKKIKSAMTYPMMIIIATAVIVYALMTVVVPSLTSSLASMGGELPTITKIVVKVSEVIQSYGVVFIGTTVAAITTFMIMYKNIATFKYSVDVILLKIPLVGTLILKLNLTQFCRLVGSLVSSGVTLDTALTIVSNTMTNALVKQKVEKVRDMVISEGRQLHAAMTEVKIFPEILIQLVMVGSSSGRIQEVLSMMAGYYEEDVELTLNTVLTYVDTLLILIIGAIVGVVVVSMFLPMFGLIDQM